MCVVALFVVCVCVGGGGEVLSCSFTIICTVQTPGPLGLQT